VCPKQDLCIKKGGAGGLYDRRGRLLNGNFGAKIPQGPSRLRKKGGHFPGGGGRRHWGFFLPERQFLKVASLRQKGGGV